MGAIAEWFERARLACADPPPEAAKAAEWILDNEFLIRRVIAQVRNDLPPGFYARLPSLANAADRGLPRVYAVAHGFL
ncbi:MAG: hypothetical protein ACREKH_03990, partial [Candidatus Rokuibacteriota bacterium]